MTPAQISTVNSITERVKKLNKNVIVGTSALNSKGHYFLCISNIRNGEVAKTTTIFCDVLLNTKGNIVSGKWNQYTPIKETKEFYHEA